MAKALPKEEFPTPMASGATKPKKFLRGRNRESVEKEAPSEIQAPERNRPVERFGDHGAPSGPVVSRER